MAKRVLAISSEVVWGAVGNSAAVPGLQARGIETLALPTVILSNHPGLGKPAGLRLPATDMAEMLTALTSLGQLAACDGVLTGYFASPEQIMAVVHTIRAMKAAKPDLLVLVDPVLGDDHTGLYVPEAVAIALRDQLLPLASISTPNRFELAWLTGQSVMDQPSAAVALRQLGLPEAVATSVPAENDAHLATIYADPVRISAKITRKRAEVPHGTGDLFSGLYLAHRLQPADGPDALARAIGDLESVIEASTGAPVLALAQGLTRGRAP